jgi:O-antigen ligase
MVVYVWYFVTTPDARFQLFAEIHFERILVFFVVLALFSGRRIPRQLSQTTVLLLLFYFWSLLSYSLSSYTNTPPSVWWIENYWKLMLFYFFLFYSIRSLRDLFTIAAGVCAISFFYQLHTWYDFVNGGSYVYQQGLKRIIGVWSGGGIGAANNYGMLGLFSLPFGIFWLKVTQSRNVRIGLIFFLGMCFASIVFSGTRAALLGALVLLVLTFWRSIFHLKVMAPLIIVLIVSASLLPEELKHRYFGQIVESDQQIETDERFDRIAEESAKSRIQGLIDGWALAMQRPFMGHGPGSSALARREVNSIDSYVNEADGYLELHNLYGQVIAETGFVGAFLFLGMVVGAIIQLRAPLSLPQGESSDAVMVQACRDLLQTSLLITLVYGMFTHSLYRYYWLLLFACHAAFMQLMRNRKQRPDDVRATAHEGSA